MKNFDSICASALQDERDIDVEVDMVLLAAGTHKKNHGKCDDHCREFFKSMLPEMTAKEYRINYRRLCDILGV